ncbi:hypothetical protein LTR95_000793 [Oleoguttula sp. CCFEE 5521]
MINQTLLAEIFSNTTKNSWQARCITQLNNSAFSNVGLVDGYGAPIPDLNAQTWGIDYETCNAQCNYANVPYRFDFQDFSSSFTNYFLPYLALTAQLPYETGDGSHNVMAFFLALGSPALITYSLTLTILNRAWVKVQFRRLKDKASRLKTFGIYEDRVQSAMLLLQEAQQVPLRASQQNGWFSSLIVGPDNADWWERITNSLKSTRRGLTASLVAQTATAIVAYSFTVTASFLANRGDPTTALQISSGNL